MLDIKQNPTAQKRHKIIYKIQKQKTIGSKKLHHATTIQKTATKIYNYTNSDKVDCFKERCDMRDKEKKNQSRSLNFPGKSFALEKQFYYHN